MKAVYTGFFHVCGEKLIQQTSVIMTTFHFGKKSFFTPKKSQFSARFSKFIKITPGVLFSMLIQNIHLKMKNEIILA